MDTDVKESGTNTRSSFGGGGTLRNEDFRQLLSRKATHQPSSTSSSNIQPQKQPTHTFSHRQAVETKKVGNNAAKVKRHKERGTVDDDDEIFGQANLNEILKNYRDRAEERRKGIHKDDAADELQASSAYRAVPGDVRATADAAQRRKQAIQESKYLGGDMEHTHLVKGLDYSLLHKVRSEIAVREQKNEDTLENQISRENIIEEPRSDNRMVRNIHRILFQNDLPVRNELFRKGRMAYVVDLDEEENDLPTTRLRSSHDCPVTESIHDINTSNMLIQKLTQVLSYLRADTQKKKKTDNSTSNDDRTKAASQAIFDDERDFAQPRNNERDRFRDRDNKRRAKPSSYFDDDDRDAERGRDRDRIRDHDRYKERSKRNREEEKSRREEVPRVVEVAPVVEKKRKYGAETEGYAECYPGGMYEAAGESDDEADYSKMDMGSRRGPVKRWDFDDHADYEKYMESKEALPKAAYQFGVKTNDGRKTRKSGPDKEKHKLDREFSQITKILEKRKVDGHRSDVAKKIRY